MTYKDILDLVRKYQEAQESHKSIYLDADEFDELADYFDTNGDLDEAREVVRAGLLIHPHSTSLLTKKAKFAVYDGEYTKALRILAESTSYDFELYLIKIECFLNLGLDAEAIELTKEIIDKEDTDRDNVYSELGFVYLEVDYFEEAILYFEKSLEYNSESSDVLSDLAYSYEMLGNYDAAIATINRALDVDSYNYEAWINLGKMYTLKDEYEKAVDAFDFALTIQSDDFNVLKLKGHCLSLCGRADEAIEVFNSILDATPDDTSIYILLAECYQSLEQYDKALSLLETYKASDVDSGLEYVAKKVQLLLLKGQMDEAMHFIEGEMIDNEDALPLCLIAAEIRLQQEKYDAAEELLLSVYEGNEDDFHLLNMLSILSIRKENYQQAIEYTMLLTEIDPEQMEIKQRLAVLYFEVNDDKHFNELLEQFDDKELLDLFKHIYIPQHEELFDREMLISYLNDARERRTLFKNLQY